MTLQEKIDRLSAVYAAHPISTSNYATSTFQGGKIYFLENSMSARAIETARYKFRIAADATIVYFFDQVNNASQGFLVTDKAIYWRRTALTKAQGVPLADVKCVSHYANDSGQDVLFVETHKADINTYVDINGLVFDFLNEVLAVLGASH